jgi:hypothetical protein
LVLNILIPLPEWPVLGFAIKGNPISSAPFSLYAVLGMLGSSPNLS